MSYNFVLLTFNSTFIILFFPLILSVINEAMSGTAEHINALEELIFSAEHACKVASNSPVGEPETEHAVLAAENTLIKLQSLLSYFSASSDFEQWHSQPLLGDCLTRLAFLRLRNNRSLDR